MRLPALLPALALICGVALQPVQALGTAPLLCAGLLSALVGIAARRRRIRIAALCLACGCCAGARAETDARGRVASLDSLFSGGDVYLGPIVGSVSDRLLTDAEATAGYDCAANGRLHVRRR